MSNVEDAKLKPWALVGASPAGQFLLERHHVRADFPLACVCQAGTSAAAPLRTYSLPRVENYDRLLNDPEISGLVVTVPRVERKNLLQAALAAGKRVLVEGDLGLSAAEAHQLSQSCGDRIGVFTLRSVDEGFQTARQAVRSGRLGKVHTLRYLSCEMAMPASRPQMREIPHWERTLQEHWPSLFSELQQLTTSRFLLASAWPSAHTAGFSARLEGESGTIVWIDLQRQSFAGLTTGWVLEGETGAYLQRRIITRATDGELISEDLTRHVAEESDVMANLQRLATSGIARGISLMHAVRGAALAEAIATAALTIHPVPVAQFADDSDAAGSSPDRTATTANHAVVRH